MLSGNRLEVEVAVARGSVMLARAVFRSPHGFSVGSSEEATLTISDSPLQSRIEILDFVDETPLLCFSEDTKLEVDSDGERLSGKEIIDRGMADARGGQHRLRLTDGVRAVLVLGSVKLLLKVRSLIEVSVWDLRPGQVGVCGGCSSKILWPPSTKVNALIPCPECGDLNRFVPSSADEVLAPASDSEELSSRTGGAASLPSTDGIVKLREASTSDTPVDSQALGPDSTAFDDEEEATELASVEPSDQSVIQATEDADEEAPTDPGRNLPDAPPPAPEPLLPPPQANPAPSGPRPAFASTPDAEPSLVPPIPESPDPEPTGRDFLVPRRRRVKARPNYLGWTLVFFGMLSGLAGLVLLAISALRLSGSA